MTFLPKNQSVVGTLNANDPHDSASKIAHGDKETSTTIPNWIRRRHHQTTMTLDRRKYRTAKPNRFPYRDKNGPEYLSLLP